MTPTDVLAQAVREIEDIAQDEMDLDRYDLSAILSICHRAKVRAAVALGRHDTTITEGGMSNYTVECSCGKRWGCATTNRTFAESSAAEHAAKFSPSEPKQVA